MSHAATIFPTWQFCMPFMMVRGVSLVLLWGFGLWFLDGCSTGLVPYPRTLLVLRPFDCRKSPGQTSRTTWSGFFEVNVGWPLVCGWQSLLLSRSYNFSGRWGTWSTNWASHFMQRRAYCLGIKCRGLLTEPRYPYGGVFVRCWICLTYSQILSTHAERRRYLHALCMWCDYISTRQHDCIWSMLTGSYKYK